MYWPDYDICLADFEDDRSIEDESSRSEKVVPSDYSRLLASVLVVFLGGAGIHRLYLGKTDTALSMLVLLAPSALAPWYPLGWLFLTVLAVWLAVDCFMVLSGRMQDGDGRPIKNW